MTAALPNWPRLMPADLACRYVGFSRTAFLLRVGDVWPEGIKVKGKRLWDRQALDAAVDQLAGKGAVSDPFVKGIYNGRGQSAAH